MWRLLYLYLYYAGLFRCSTRIMASNVEFCNIFWIFLEVPMQRRHLISSSWLILTMSACFKRRLRIFTVDLSEKRRSELASFWKKKKKRRRRRSKLYVNESFSLIEECLKMFDGQEDYHQTGYWFKLSLLSWALLRSIITTAQAPPPPPPPHTHTQTCSLRYNLSQIACPFFSASWRTHWRE